MQRESAGLAVTGGQGRWYALQMILKLIIFAAALYIVVSLLTRGARKDGRLKEEANRAVTALATTTRYVLIAILAFVVVALVAFVWGIFSP